MTTPHQAKSDSSDNHPRDIGSVDIQFSDRGWDRRCALYLLGELPGDQAAEFEKRLQASPQLGEELLRQADVIAALSLVRPVPEVPVAAGGSVFRWSRVAWILAIAACIVMVVIVGRAQMRDQESLAGLGELPANVSDTSEDLLIARAWADSHLDVATDEFFNLEVDDAVAISADDPAAVDSTLSWMFIAVSSSLDAHASEATNDGATNDG